jgi:TatD DNase family protein
MIDSHCHLDCDAFAVDREGVLQRAQVAGVTDIVVPAVDESTWQPILALQGRSGAPRCHGGLGIHPVALPAMLPEDDTVVLKRLESAMQRARLVAVGECGLDTTIDLGQAPIERQERMLDAQLALARSAHLPVILHARGPGATDRLFRLLDRTPAGWSGVLHSYGGGAELLRQYLHLPLCFGYAGPATYSNARKIRAAIAATPADRLLAETDAPDQTPEPHRPGRSEPAYLADVIRGLAAARGTGPEDIQSLTAANARRIFCLDKSGPERPPAQT